MALIKNQREQRTVILSTHNLNEIEQIAHRVLMIKSGKIILDESLKVLLKASKDDQSQPPTLKQIFINLHQLNANEETTQQVANG